MQRFFTGRLDGPQCSGKPFPPIGEVSLGETFIIESTLEEERETLGPLFIRGVKSGDVVSIHIEDIHISKWEGIESDYPHIPEIVERLREVGVKEFAFYTPLDNGELVLPGDIRVPLRPMIGSLSLAALERSPNPWDHGGNMDINEIRKGSTVYIRAQREGGLFALGDLHAYQGDGELAGSANETNGEATVTVDVSDRFPAPRPVIEREGKIMTVGMGLKYWDAVRTAIRDMTYLLMKTREVSLEEAYCVAVMGASLRNGALWMMSDNPQIAMENDDRTTPRTVFLELPFKKEK
jgi:amidase